MKYVAQWYMPGCLPETERFDTFAAAQAFILAELAQIADDDDAPPGIGDTIIDIATETTPFAYTCGAYVYSVETE